LGDKHQKRKTGKNDAVGHFRTSRSVLRQKERGEGKSVGAAGGVLLRKNQGVRRPEGIKLGHRTMKPHICYSIGQKKGRGGRSGESCWGDGWGEGERGVGRGGRGKLVGGRGNLRKKIRIQWNSPRAVEGSPESRDLKKMRLDLRQGEKMLKLQK